jgi:LacI family transcriptional regulator
MKKKASLKTIAKNLGLSAGTVSRALNGKAKEFRISDETVDAIKKHAEEIGYSPNLIAKGLQASRTFTIGLMIPDIANPFFAIMAKNIEKAASKANFSIILVDAEEDTDKEKRQVQNMIGRKVDGIIAAPVGTSFDHFLEIEKQKIPLLFVDRYFTDSTIPYITSDNFQGSFDAIKLFFDNGHTKIALIKGDETAETVRERTKGYRHALEKNGIPFEEKWVTGNEFSIENGYLSTKQLLNLPNPPTAIFALNNLIGFGVLKAIKEMGLTIPADISLIIFDDEPFLSLLSPSITAVKQDSEKIGEIAVAFILEKIDNEGCELSPVIVPTEIIFRGSVKKI